MSEADWQSLLRLPMWCTLDRIYGTLEPVAPNLLRIAEGAYASVGPWAENWQPAPDELRLLGLWWAASEPAAIAARSGESFETDQPHRVEPPTELLIGGRPGYELLRLAIEMTGGGEVSDVGKRGGGFFAHVLQQNPFGYYFRNECPTAGEFPFAIRVVPKSARYRP